MSGYKSQIERPGLNPLQQSVHIGIFRNDAFCRKDLCDPVKHMLDIFTVRGGTQPDMKRLFFHLLQRVGMVDRGFEQLQHLRPFFLQIPARRRKHKSAADTAEQDQFQFLFEGPDRFCHHRLCDMHLLGSRGVAAQFSGA